MDNMLNIINQLNFTNVMWQLILSLSFMLGDVIVGLIGAAIRNSIDSQKMREGLLRKMLLIIVIVLSFLVQYGFNITVISKVICFYIIAMEIVSILENLKKAGIDFGKIGELLKVKPDEETIKVELQKRKEI